MDFFGMGSLELVTVLLVGVIVLGPAKIVDVGRSLGKFWGEAQRTLRETADAATIRLDAPLNSPKKNEQGAGAAAPAGAVTSPDNPNQPPDGQGPTPPDEPNGVREDNQRHG